MDGRHPLADWINEQRDSQAEFAAEVGCSQPHLSLVLQNKRGVSMKLAARISRATGGAIPVDAFSPEAAE